MKDAAIDGQKRESFSVRVDFLSRPALAAPSRPGRLEWPPHPHRLFAAIAAAHYETGIGRRETLEWLEQQGPPEISAPRIEERTSGVFYVPVNDPISEKSFEKSAVDLPLGDRRIRQERDFAVGSLLPTEGIDGADHRSVYYTWRGEATPPDDLDGILREVTRLGHSSSLVAVSLWLKEPPTVRFLPSDQGDLWLRVAEPGTLGRLDEAHEVRNLPTSLQDQRKATLEPEAWASYRRSHGAEPVTGPWSNYWVWSIEPRISVTAWIHLADAIRGTILQALPEQAPEVLTGHGCGNHVAVIPLPHVDHPHADGAVLGFAVLAPELAEAERDTLLLALGELTAIGKKGEIRAGAAGRFRAETAGAHEMRRTLQMETWTGPGRTWATVTPLVFDRYSKKKLPSERIVAESAERLGLPAPVEVILGREALLSGTPRSSDFRVHRPERPGGRRSARRPWSHAILRWDRPVEGPIVLGAKRHFGLGLCRPLRGT